MHGVRSDTVAPDVGLEIAESSSNPETVERCAFGLICAAISNLAHFLCGVVCESLVYVDVSFFCTLSYLSCGTLWHMQQKVTANACSCPVPHHRHAAMAMRWRCETMHSEFKGQDVHV